jgi:hypothetical protein
MSRRTIRTAVWVSFLLAAMAAGMATSRSNADSTDLKVVVNLDGIRLKNDVDYVATVTATKVTIDLIKSDILLKFHCPPPTPSSHVSNTSGLLHDTVSTPSEVPAAVPTQIPSTLPTTLPSLPPGAFDVTGHREN